MLARIYYRAVATDAVGVKQLVVLTLPSRPICVPKGRQYRKDKRRETRDERFFRRKKQGVTPYRKDERRQPFKARDILFSMEKQVDDEKKENEVQQATDFTHIVNSLLQTNHFSMQF